MWVYIYFPEGLWTVGHYAPDGHFVPESDRNSRQEAAAHVNYLNGGNGVPEADQRGDAVAFAQLVGSMGEGRRH